MMTQLRGIKGEMNIITILMAVITALGGFGSFTLFEAYQTAKSEIMAMREYRQAISERLQKLEVTNEDKWRSIDSAIGALNSKFDMITEVKLKKSSS